MRTCRDFSIQWALLCPLARKRSLSLALRLAVVAALAGCPLGSEALGVPASDTPKASPGAGSKAITIEISGAVRFTTPDEHADGIKDALVAEVGVKLHAPGKYVVMGELWRGKTLVASRPGFETALDTRADVAGEPGAHVAQLRFSGEQILRSGLDGPYELRVFAGDSRGWVRSSLMTPAYHHREFGEAALGITAVEDSATDDDGDGTADSIAVSVRLTVRTPGQYVVQAVLEKNRRTLVSAGGRRSLAAGNQVVTLRISGKRLRQSQMDGPYSLVVTVASPDRRIVASKAVATKPYRAKSFGG